MASRSPTRRRTSIAVLACAILLPASGGAKVVTYANDASRIGWYNNQPLLSPSNVSSSAFQRRYEVQLLHDDGTQAGDIYAQPLVALNVLLIVTEDNWVYGLDPGNGAVRWQHASRDQAGNPERPWDPFNDATDPCGDLLPTVGITGTPVIDD